MANNNNQKFGRNAKRGQAQRYAAENRHTRNKEIRRQRTAKRQPNNQQIQLTTPEQRRAFDASHRANNNDRLKRDTSRWLDTLLTVRKNKKLSNQDAVTRFPGHADPRLLFSLLLQKEKEKTDRLRRSETRMPRSSDWPKS